MLRLLVSWSGGKDTCLALYRAMKMGLDVVSLFTMLGEEGATSSSHGLSRELLDAQAKSLGVSTAYGKASKRDYEQQFKKMVMDHESRSIQGGVFGDINLQEHRD
jgi:diphthamide synthase (EF-2-diphthine--ammonia ligase)